MVPALLVVAQITGAMASDEKSPLAPEIQAYFEQYLATPELGFFAVSADGCFASYSYCPESFCEEGLGYVALRGCNGQDGRGCKIYAEGATIVWPDVKSCGRR